MLKQRRVWRKYALLATAVTCGGYSGAYAQEAGPQTGPAEEKRDVIVVTGEKFDRTLQETTASIAVTTAARIEEENLQSLYDVIERTANMSETYGTTGFTIRGISNSSVTGGGAGGLATVYVDGAALNDEGAGSGPLGMWDVAQVEVLRGPQSTLQGRNALAGAIIIRTQDPTWDWTAKSRVMFTDADETVIALAAGGPVIDDQLAIRLSLEDRTADGFVYNPVQGEDANALDSLNVRLKALIEPDALPELSLLATYARNERHAGYLFGYSRTDVPGYWDNRLDLSNDPNSVDNLTEIFSLEADYDLPGNFSLTNVLAYSMSEQFEQFDGDLGPTTETYGSWSIDENILSNELRLNYDGDRLQALGGVYYARRDYNDRNANLVNVETPVSTLVGVLMSFAELDQATAEMAAGLYASALPVIPVDYRGTGIEETETIAAFADATFDLTPRLHLHGGFRYDTEDFTLGVTQATQFVGVYPDPALYAPFEPAVELLNFAVGGFVAQAGGSSPVSTRSFEAFLPKAGITYDWTSDLSTSFVVQRGYRSGGASANTARSTVVAYDPEYTWNYELALRSTWLNGALTLNANAFYVDWTDQQVNVNLGLNAYDNQIENAGKSHLYGFELEASHRVSPNLDWYASVGHTRTKFDEFVVTSGGSFDDLTGSEFAYAPHWTASGGVNYAFGNGVFLNVNASWRDQTFAGVGVNQAQWEIGDRALVNGKFGYNADTWSVSIFGNNLFDEKYVQYPREADGVSLLGDPRVIGVLLETNW